MSAAPFTIPIDHPALAGHFPGNPIVPGSMILEQVLIASPEPVGRMDFSKFHQILRPGEAVHIGFLPSRSGAGLDFTCHQADRLICSGRLIIAPER